ncbi:hypothetical protein NLG97_g6909 [Lecanicillium saksenae]|uniref:Uncharacterized protein n=1 Tax=Lecanicillium saksenae TaxID=468837 RepID=A0ACC1QS43_9HYPO|nr:hypothetical protein NLG97_g6909 [Lecanicillium saksenae]
MRRARPVPLRPQRLNPPLRELQEFYVGKDIRDVPRPVLIMDQAKMRRHCESLQQAADSLGVALRTHIKSHKASQDCDAQTPRPVLLITVAQTVEGTELQVNDKKDVRLIVSTVAELELLAKLIDDYVFEDRQVNILYGVPLVQSQVTRLAAISWTMGEATLSFLVDHPDQIRLVRRYCHDSLRQVKVFVKVDTGYHRAGLPPSAINKGDLISQLLELNELTILEFAGLYSHSSLSYNGTTPVEAMASLEAEITGCMDALRNISHMIPKGKKLTISVGASPQVLAVENLVQGGAEPDAAAQSLRAKMQAVMAEGVAGVECELELHAGVYSVMDMQQLATNARPNLGSYEEEIAVSVLSEVVGVYNDGERAQPEVLLSVGVLGLGREPCPSYKGWGVLDRSTFPPGVMDDRRLIISRISQEHCIVTWDEDSKGNITDPIPVKIGQKVRIFPNHACITGALYGWYVVVDSSNGRPGLKIVDVWPRASGW